MSIRKPFLILTIATLSSILILLLCIPRKTKLVYNYEVGNPWKYATLIADVNFTVKKSDAAFHAELDSVMRSFEPFYNLNVNVQQQQLKDFMDDYKAGEFGKVPPSYIQYVKAKLKEVYDIGMVTPQQMSILMMEAYPSIRIINDNEASSTPTDKIFTTRSAYDYIMSADSLHFSHALLTRMAVNNYLSPNLNYDKLKSSLAKKDIRRSVIRDKGPIMQGERIVDQGQMITPEIKEKIDSYEAHINEYRAPYHTQWLQLLGQGLSILILLISFAYYLLIYRRNYVLKYQKLALFYILITIFPVITFIMLRHQWLSEYLVPFAMIPLFVSIFFDSRTASMCMIVGLLITSLCVPNPFEFFLIEIIMGLTTIYALKELSDRAQILRVAAYVMLVGISVQFAWNLADGQNILHMSPYRFAYIGLSGIGLLFAYPLMYAIERTFGFTSGVTLMELNNINHPLLRKMAKEAQGTFNHSMMVSNLAAEVANKIGADAQLVRTGALYHDIGKMDNPAFFTENQTGINPHDQLEDTETMSKEERSAQIIIEHVTGGMEKAEKYHLPKVVRDFITTHHGRSQTKYFYITWQNKHPNATPRTELFTYPGPNPFTKEQAILMMCDAVEASSRSLKEYTEESLTALVNKIIDGQVAEGYFRESPITFRDIYDVKKVLVDSLKTIYHTRIAYPEMNKKNSKSKAHRSSLLGNGFMHNRKHQ